MNNELPIPYGDYIYLQPVKENSIFSQNEGTLYTFGEVLAVGQEAKFTSVGDNVAFELWDKAEFQRLTGETCHFVREKDVICKIPESWAIKNDIQK